MPPLSDQDATPYAEPAPHGSDRAILDLLRAAEGATRAYLRVAIPSPADRAEALAEVMAATCVELAPDFSRDAAIARAIEVARRIAANWRRDQRHLVPLYELDETISDLGTDDVAYRESLWAYECRLLGRLSPLQRVALELFEMDDLSDREIAGISGCSERTLPELRRKAKLRCRALIVRGEIGSPPERDSAG